MAGSTGYSLSYIMPKMLSHLITHRPSCGALYLAAATVLLCSTANAQDAATTSSGELKDFRLDNPPPKQAEPEPKIEPSAQPPNAAAIPDQKIPTENAARKKERPKADSQRPNTDAMQPSVTGDPSPATAPATNTKTVTDIVEATKPTPKNATPRPIPNTERSFDFLSFWPLLAALVAALAGLALFRLWKGRMAAANIEALPLKVFPKHPAKSIEPPPLPHPETTPVTGQLETRFEPDNARLSVANLTVTGRLHLRYDGDAPIESLRLRTLMVSVCDDQKVIIDRFHRNAEAGQINNLGPVAAGEEIRMKLELQLPRDALQAFDWRERRFVAPIVLINIASDVPGIQTVRITCLVGQAGDATSARLQPLPIDRGPKLFDTLQFRPIAA